MPILRFGSKRVNAGPRATLYFTKMHWLAILGKSIKFIAARCIEQRQRVAEERTSALNRVPGQRRMMNPGARRPGESDEDGLRIGHQPADILRLRFNENRCGVQLVRASLLILQAFARQLQAAGQKSNRQAGEHEYTAPG